MRAIKPEVNGRADFYAQYAPRSKVEIIIPYWPRRQRFGYIMWAEPMDYRKAHHTGAWLCLRAKIALPERFRLTDKAWREMGYWDMRTGMDFEQATPLHPEDMARIPDDDDLLDFGADLTGAEFSVIEPHVRPVQRVARLVKI